MEQGGSILLKKRDFDDEDAIPASEFRQTPSYKYQRRMAIYRVPMVMLLQVQGGNSS